MANETAGQTGHHRLLAGFALQTEAQCTYIMPLPEKSSLLYQ